jgi:tetratricopeptide (TPR) repeat protein
MSALRLALAAALAVLAVLAALAASDVRAWHSALAGGDTAYLATPFRAIWTPHPRLGGLAEAALGVRDDVELRKALQLYVDAAKLHLRLDNAVDVESARAHAQDALEQVSRAGDPQRRSQVLTLLGILAFRAAAAGGAQSQLDAALSDFTDAVRADPTDEQAAYDLELLLQLTAAHGTRVQPGQGGGFGRTGRRGAGGGLPGSGY